MSAPTRDQVLRWLAFGARIHQARSVRPVSPTWIVWQLLSFTLDSRLNKGRLFDAERSLWVMQLLGHLNGRCRDVRSAKLWLLGLARPSDSPEETFAILEGQGLERGQVANFKARTLRLIVEGICRTHDLVAGKNGFSPRLDSNLHLG